MRSHKNNKKQLSEQPAQINAQVSELSGVQKPYVFPLSAEGVGRGSQSHLSFQGDLEGIKGPLAEDLLPPPQLVPELSILYREENVHPVSISGNFFINALVR